MLTYVYKYTPLSMLCSAHYRTQIRYSTVEYWITSKYFMFSTTVACNTDRLFVTQLNISKYL